jgi:type III pantothenate kinase
MQLIAANIGNSSTKVAVDHTEHEHHWLLESVIRGDEPIEFNFRELDIDQEPAFWSVCSVNRQRQSRLADWVAERRPADLFHVIQASEVELESDVQSRERLGRDRLVAAWQAVQLNEGGPLIVIDAGTAVTIDVVDQKNVLQGGMIFPGARASLDSLSAETDALPNLAADSPGEFSNQLILGCVGKSTESAIRLGVYQAQISVIKAAVKQLTNSHGPLEVYLTGGGIQELTGWLPDLWQQVPDLVLQGAKAIGKDLLDQLIRES